MTGAILGDFATQIGGAGRLVQVVLGFVPGISTVCAVRDLVADYRQKDHFGALLNGLAMLPVVGGISKIAAVIRATRRMSKAVRAARKLAAPTPVDMPIHYT